MPAPAKAPRPSRALRCECHLIGTLVLDGQRVPVGRCWVRQSPREVLLGWHNTEGRQQQREISVELLRQLLDEGLIQRLA